MQTVSREVAAQLLEVQSIMRKLMDNTIRDGMVRVVPDLIEARRIVEIHVRLQLRIRAMELALKEFQADLDRAERIFDDAQRRAPNSDVLDLEGEALRHEHAA